MGFILHIFYSFSPLCMLNLTVYLLKEIICVLYPVCIWAQTTNLVAISNWKFELIFLIWQTVMKCSKKTFTTSKSPWCKPWTMIFKCRWRREKNIEYWLHIFHHKRLHLFYLLIASSWIRLLQVSEPAFYLIFFFLT